MNFYQKLPKPFFVLAPMDDVTDTVFRQIVKGCTAPDLCMTEFVNADGLQSPGRQKLLKKLRFSETELPLVAQIWGREPENFRLTADQIADGTFARELGLPKGTNFVGVDLNMGCPQKSEVNNGTCSALINDRPRAHEIIEATREGLAGRLPLSVKTRLGYGEVDLTWIEFLLQHDLDMLTIHGRTKRQMSKVPANWDLIGECRQLRDKLAPQTLIVGNGDVRDRNHGLELIQKYGLDGVMIGRGIFQDPFAFAEASPWQGFSKQQRVDLYKKHVQLYADTWQNRERPIQTLNKFCKIYISDFDGAKELREQLMNAGSIDELLALLNV
ncbi:MAG TPA: tRNA-dihydrouridine synthase [Candidatus Saccharimonadales bacterium]|nr:tRNA-dihydrouridine synthase [Candidatus Saccharimonadales bacterium]